jgi:hypothetical protein
MRDIEDNKSAYNIKSLKKNKNALQYQIHSLRVKCALSLLSSLHDKLSAIDEDINYDILNIENDKNIREKLDALELNMYSLPFNISEYDNQSSSNVIDINNTSHQNGNALISENVNVHVLDINEVINTNHDIQLNKNITLSIIDRLWIIVSDAMQGLYNCRKRDSFDPKPLYRIAQTLYILAYNNNNCCTILENSTSLSNIVDTNKDDTHEQYIQLYKKSVVMLLPPIPIWLIDAIGNGIGIVNVNISGNGKAGECETAIDLINIGNPINTTTNNNNNAGNDINLPSTTTTTSNNSMNHSNTIFTIDMAYKEMYKMFDKKREQIVAIWMSEIANNDLDLVQYICIYYIYIYTYMICIYLSFHIIFSYIYLFVIQVYYIYI